MTDRHPRDAFRFADPWPMSPAMVARFHGLIRAFTPAEPVVPELEVRIEQQVRRMMRYMQPVIARAFVLALVTLDLAPVWMFKRWARLQDLPRDEAGALLSQIQHGPIGVLADMVMAARAAVLAPYYDLDEVGRHIGWEPGPFMRERIALRARLLQGRSPELMRQAMIGPFSAATGGGTGAGPGAATTKREAS
ncbi:MAG: hypothetical protein IT385_11575 [Deltaproteobacteria bacterium]|nr:hypothetical protein [Deltaproteobacteria bacterium]